MTKICSHCQCTFDDNEEFLRCPQCGQFTSETSVEVAPRQEPMGQEPMGQEDSIEGVSFSGKNAFDEIVDFGNSDVSAVHDGSLFFDLMVSGIDSAHLLEELKEALSDSKLRLDLEGILGSIHNGTVTLRKISGVKASVIVNRLKTFPFDISWTQYAVTALTCMACVVFIFLSPSLVRSEAWGDHKSSTVAKQTKIRSLEALMRELIVEKRKIKDADRKKEIVNELRNLHQEFTKVSASYHEEQLHMRFRHPEKGSNEKNNYTTHRVQTLEEMESEVGLDGQLTRVQTKIHKVYNISEDEAKKRTQVKEKEKQEKGQRQSLKLVY